eukprot:m.854956 g.854956  ORF g.854956 m.854956 type:complete len:109 (+) comp59623_c0_seq27:120-446(+)
MLETIGFQLEGSRTTSSLWPALSAASTQPAVSSDTLPYQQAIQHLLQFRAQVRKEALAARDGALNPATVLQACDSVRTTLAANDVGLGVQDARDGSFAVTWRNHKEST